MSRQDVAADRVLSLTLKFGAYTALALIVAGLMLQFFVPWGGKVTSAGLLVLLITPALRISGGVRSVFARARFQVCSCVVWCAGDCGCWRMCWGYRPELYR